MTKKVTLLILAALFVAVGSFALGRPKGVPQSKKQLELFAKNNTKVEGLVPLPKRAHAAARRAPGNVIYDQPEGTLVSYYRTSDAYLVYWGYVFNTSVDGSVVDVVFADDNKIYFKNLISQYTTDSWTQGTINGNTITIQFPQVALLEQSSAYFLNYGTLKNDYSFVPAGALTLNYNPATREISSSDPAFANGTKLLALVSGQNEWAGFADWNIKLNVVTDEFVQAPANIETSVYSVSGNGIGGTLVNVGFDGNDVYIQGLDKALPESWVKGTLNGNKLTIANGQYLGADSEGGYHHFLFSAKEIQTYDEDYDEYYTDYELLSSDITFNYDADTKTFSNGSYFVINGGKNEANPVLVFDNAQITPFQEVAATPAAPQGLEIDEGGTYYFSQGYGWGELSFDILSNDVDGNFINTDKLSYAIWVKVNGEEKQLTLTADDYVEFTVPSMDEIPYDYSDDWDIYIDGIKHSVYYYVIGPEAYGVQAIYRGAGEERRSTISWVRVKELGAAIQPAAATPAYPDIDPADTGSQIDYGFYTGKEELDVVTNNYKEETYDVAVKIQDPALVGAHIESITFPIQDAQGLSNISVWLSSQLRVENGKNVPDLVSKSVAETEEGLVTVTLDKPYTIPAEGVYVGYSLTVDDLSASSLNATPVVVTDKVHDGGFYLHTSDGFLKWLDVTDVFGGDAVLNVTLSGKVVKDNAAAVAQEDKQFVKVGEPIQLPVTVVNHGAKGISALDIEYSVAGQTGSRHVDVTPAVDGFFGLATPVTLNLPAISERGNYDLTLKVAKVNGVDNQETNTVNVPVVALTTTPKHRVLLEEYTGFWCGWCPRGYVALEKLAELYPDDYVLVSYHNEDELEIMPSYYYPSQVSGFPSAYIERNLSLDAYYGTSINTSSPKEFGIVDDLQERAKTFGVADIALTAKLDESLTKINVNAQVTFPFDVKGGQYALEYILTHDKLSDPTWGQSNYYADGYANYPKYLDDFTKTSAETVYGLTFNDVAVQTSTIGGIRNSVPADITADAPVSHSYTFNLLQAINTSNASVIQNKKNLNVVGLLVDKATGNVVNAIKVKVDATTAISDVATGNNEQTTVTYYDLSGRKVAKPARGGVYVKTVSAHGETVSEKVLVK